MHLSYYFIRQISQYLAETICDWQLGTAFSQEKDELILGFYLGRQEFFIRAQLTPQWVGVSFPAHYAKAKANAIELFEMLHGRRLMRVEQFHNERAFCLHFEEDYCLLFKLFGNRSNLIVYKGNEVIDLFHKKMEEDTRLHPSSLHRSIELSEEAFIASGGKIRELFPAFDRLTMRYIELQGWLQLPLQAQWQKLLALHEQLLTPRQYYVGMQADKPQLSLIEHPELQVHCTTTSPIEAANELHRLYVHEVVFLQEKQHYLKQIEQQLRRCETTLQKSKERLGSLKEARFEEIGHLIMANLHSIAPRSEEIEIYDFYRDAPLHLRLNPHLTPQQNAERFYRKAKNQKIEEQKLQETIESKENEWLHLERLRQALESCHDFKSLRRWAKQHGFMQQGKEEETLPFKRFEYRGFQIWVGKNAKSNDLLTQRFAHKNDLWLHAKDVAGSHVVIKRSGQKQIPKEVIEKAASLAAYYSKRKTDSLCPVIVTEKKYVRKPKGLAPGQVIVDKEEVIMVAPAPFE